MTYCYPYRKGTGWRSQGFRTNRNQGVNGPGGHTGFDEAMDAGTPLYAPADGIIRNSSWVSENYLDNPWWLTQMGGDILVIDCFGPDGTTDTGPTFVLAHLSDSIADVGQRVRKGELVALSGSSGTASTGPHVHVEALPPNWDFNNGVYGRVDPESYFDEWPDAYIGSSGLAAMAGTITELPQGVFMALSDKEQAELLDGVRNLQGYLYKGGPSVSDATGDPASIFGRLITTQEQNRDVQLALTVALPELRSKKDGAVNVQELAKALAGQMAAAEVKALADQLQITVKEGN